METMLSSSSAQFNLRTLSGSTLLQMMNFYQMVSEFWELKKKMSGSLQSSAENRNLHRRHYLFIFLVKKKQTTLVLKNSDVYQ